MSEFRVHFTVERNDSIDFVAPGEAEALEAFWLYQHAQHPHQPHYGNVTVVRVAERRPS